MKQARTETIEYIKQRFQEVFMKELYNLAGKFEHLELSYL